MSEIVNKAFDKTEETYKVVTRLSQKLNQLDALYKTDSHRLSELCRLDKQVDRLNDVWNQLSQRSESTEDSIAKVNQRITFEQNVQKNRCKVIESDVVKVKEFQAQHGTLVLEIDKACDDVK